MLGFFDESGDPGLKTGDGSSRYFVVALVTFDDDAVALACDRRIDRLRSDLRLPSRYEFHFGKNSRKVREAFLRAVQPFDFQYHLFALDKEPGKLRGISLNPNDLYQYTAGLVFENASYHLKAAIIVMDKRGDKKFRDELFRHLRHSVRFPGGQRAIKKLKQQDSHRNNLLQLADYVASIGNQVLSGNRETIALAERYLRNKEVTRGVWPE